ncbi:MAG: Fatty acid desaturase [Myxococcaceae bacterium]|nr:Fatty acid desaturase [Myxococcaceae bacterium]
MTNLEAARSGKELIDATRPFANEDRALSRRKLLSTIALLVGASALAMRVTWWPLRLVVSTIAALLSVRTFILFHDYHHGAILRKSWVGRGLLFAYGMLWLSPPTVWRQTHNYHHAHAAKLVGSHVGSFPMVTVAMWNAMTRRQRLAYRIVRSPMTMALGYLTVFVWGMCLSPLFRAPRKHWDAALALVAHVGALVLLTKLLGVGACFFGYLLPLILATALGSYLFYAQHNFPGIHVQPRESWSYTRAALESSSYLETGPVMGWFTGNIGYHHVHHLNPQIPFYRLPEAMASIAELQHPARTALSLPAIAACLRLDLWDPVAGQMIESTL